MFDPDVRFQMFFSRCAIQTFISRCAIQMCTSMFISRRQIQMFISRCAIQTFIFRCAIQICPSRCLFPDVRFQIFVYSCATQTFISRCEIQMCPSRCSFPDVQSDVYCQMCFPDVQTRCSFRSFSLQHPYATFFFNYFLFFNYFCYNHTHTCTLLLEQSDSPFLSSQWQPVALRLGAGACEIPISPVEWPLRSACGHYTDLI